MRRAARILFGLCATALGLAAGEPVRLFDSLNPVPPPAPARAGVAPSSNSREGVATVARGLIPSAWRPGDRVEVAVPEGPPRLVRVDDVRVIEGRTEVRGRLEGEAGSSAMFVFDGEAVAAALRDGRSDPWLVGPEGGRRHRVRRWSSDTPAAPRCANVDGGHLAGPAAVQPRAGGGPAVAATVGNSVIDLLMLYTPAAEAAAGGRRGIEATLALAVLEANDAYRRSEARVALRVVGMERTAYAESGDLATDLGRLSVAGDGHLDEVQAWRDERAADLVCLVTEWEGTGQYAGMALQLSDLSASALNRGYTVCLRPYLVGNYTLPHEVGHLLGCNHDRENSPGFAMHGWAYGTRITVEGQIYRTIMAYRPGIQFPHFSNPLVNYRGVPTGIAVGSRAADNVRTLNLTAPLIAAVRDPAVRWGWRASRVEVRENAGRVRLGWERAGLTATGGVTVRTRALSAVPAQDFVPLDQRLTAQAGDHGEIELELIDNPSTDGPRTLQVELIEPAAGQAVGPVAVMEVVILDDEEEGAAPLDAGFRAIPGADGVVRAVRELDGGDVLVAGDFFRLQDQPAPRLARVSPGGAVRSEFQAVVKYAVHAVEVLSDGRLAIAGEFNTVNQVARQQLAVLRPDGTLDLSFELAATNLALRALAALPDGRLLVAGAFTNDAPVPARQVLRVLSTGALDPAFDTSNGPDAAVAAVLAEGDGGAVIGGHFRRVGGVEQAGVARLKPDGRLDPAFVPGGGVDGPVLALARRADGSLLAAGAFTRFRDATHRGVVRLTADGRLDPDFVAGAEAGTDGPVHALVVDGLGRLWLGGAFTRVDGLVRRGLARLDDGGRVDPAFDPGTGPDDVVLSLALRSGGGVYAGGVFARVNGVRRGGVAAWLDGAVAAPFFTEAVPEAQGVRWAARVATNQVYDLESSTDLKAWEPASTVSGPVGLAEGEWRGPGPTGFLRLQRRLE